MKDVHQDGCQGACISRMSRQILGKLWVALPCTGVRVYIGIIGNGIYWLYWDNGKHNGNYYLRFRV